MENSGNGRFGEHNGNAKLTAEAVHDIRSRHAQLMHDLADQYGVRSSYIAKVISGARWGHLKVNAAMAAANAGARAPQ